MATIYLIRHGESAANAGLKTYATDQIPLMPLGHEQATTVPSRLPTTLDYIIPSTYLRIKETAQPTIKKHPQAIIEEWDLIREFT